jgi:4'-phosphopantetheinyl transferase
MVRRSNVQVWAVDLDCAGGDVSLLSARERARADRLKRPDERRRSLEAHCALRRVLALQLRVDPGSLEFDATDTGKPFLAKPAQALQFNLSHSGRHSLIAVAEDRAVGIDIEMHRPMSDLLAVAMAVATAREIDLLRQLPADEMHSSFFDLWTRKEALLKATGRGFLVDPRQVDVGIGQGRSYVAFDARTWTVESLAVSASVRAAVAIEGELATALAVRRFNERVWT